MSNDPIAAALRRDAALMRELAPAPDAAALWSKVRRARARRLRHIMNLCGWGLRAALLIVFAAVAFYAPRALGELILPLLLVGWLSSGICSPPARALRPPPPPYRS